MQTVEVDTVKIIAKESRTPNYYISVDDILYTIKVLYYSIQVTITKPDGTETEQTIELADKFYLNIKGYLYYNSKIYMFDHDVYQTRIFIFDIDSETNMLTNLFCINYSVDFHCTSNIIIIVGETNGVILFDHHNKKITLLTFDDTTLIADESYKLPIEYALGYEVPYLIVTNVKFCYTMFTTSSVNGQTVYTPKQCEKNILTGEVSDCPAGYTHCIKYTSSCLRFAD